MSQDLYYSKYLKYKAKYIQLKLDQFGSGPTWIRLAGYIAEKDFAKAKSQFAGTPAFQLLEKAIKPYLTDASIPAETYDMAKIKTIIEGPLVKMAPAADKAKDEFEQAAFFTPEIKKIMKWAYSEYNKNIPK
jgi:hypothetical protein